MRCTSFTHPIESSPLTDIKRSTIFHFRLEFLEPNAPRAETGQLDKTFRHARIFFPILVEKNRFFSPDFSRRRSAFGENNCVHRHRTYKDFSRLNNGALVSRKFPFFRKFDPAGRDDFSVVPRSSDSSYRMFLRARRGLELYCNCPCRLHRSSVDDNW